jgi:hypothetical protein
MLKPLERPQSLYCVLLTTAVLLVAAPMSCIAGCYGRDGSTPQTRFKPLAGDVRDTKTGLLWKRCSLGTEWTGQGACEGQVQYLGLKEAMAAASDGWRVPSGPELQSLIDVGCGSPVVDPSVFPDIRADDEGHAKYWTTNAMGGELDLYWNFDFIDGQPDANSRGIQLFVRLVKSTR